MLSFFWTTYLYQPLFNGLIWIYINIADRNMGWAVVWLTIFLRIILLPFTIISERDAVKQQSVEEQALKASQAFKNDHVAQKEEIRRIMKKNHVSPWAKVVSLGFQVLVFVLLYQVFIRGITGDRVIKFLYSWIDFPGKVNTDFYGFNIGAHHDVFWAGIVAIYLFLSIYLGDYSKPKQDKSKMTFLFLFPAFTFFALWYLPMVKSLFVLTTMIFSDIIGTIRRMFFTEKKKDKKAEAKGH
jgi:membrane protein insertase Oxa1/YidC/SpoIIIJ